MYDAFSKHLEAEHSLESISFLTAVHHYELTYFDVLQRTNVSLARRIVAMYAGDDAVLPCTFSSFTVSDLLQATTINNTVGSQDNISVQSDVFAKAKAELCDMLYLDAFARFVVTKLFQVILDNMRKKNA